MSVTVLCHPDSFERLQKAITRQAPPPAVAELLRVHGTIEVRASDRVPEFATRWEFPQERYWRYEKSDEPWCRYFGIGREVVTDEPALYLIQDPTPPRLGRFR